MIGSRKTRILVSVFFVVLAVLIVVTRLPLEPDYLFSFEAVNLALALDYFDLHLHQPQPPGYPAFVAEARVVNVFLSSPERTFLACSLLATLAGPLLLFFLGARMFSRWVGAAAALLLVLDPVFWHASLASPIRPYLSVGAVLVAYLGYRAACGEARFAYYSAIALGLAAGWRPSLLVFLAPLWLLCAWFALKSARRMVLALVLLALASLTWLIPLEQDLGDLRELWKMCSDYLRQKALNTSPLYGAGFWGWTRMTSQVLAWFALTVLPWVWAIPLLLLKRRGTALPPLSRAGEQAAPLFSKWLFLLAWVTPSVCFFFFVYAERPGHMLAVVPALCLIGAAFLERAAERTACFFRRRHAPRIAFLSAALGLAFLLFVFPFHLPGPHPAGTGVVQRTEEQLRFWGAMAVYQSSRAHIQAMNLRNSERMDFIRALGASPATSIVWQDDDVTWRKITYYFPACPTWVLEGLSGPGAGSGRRPLLWLQRRIERAGEGDEKHPLLVPDRGRLAWLLHLSSPFPAELRSQGVPLRQAGTMFVTDLARAPRRFHAGPFVFEKTPLNNIVRAD